MKYPNTGLFSYCDKVAENLARFHDMVDGDRLQMYVPEQYDGRWGDEVSYRHVWGWHKHFLPCGPGVKVWHCAHQGTRYVPPKGVKVVLTVHDLNFLYEKTVEKRGKYIRKLQKLVDRADYIVTISEFAKKDLLENINTQGKPIEVIYNGLNSFDGDITPPVRQPEHEFLFSVGTVLPKKNFHVLPALLKDNEYELIIAGNKSAYADRIMAEAAALGVESRVHIIGPVSEAEKFWYIKNCKAFLFPSIAEGFGLPVIEAMYYEKPVFLSDRTSLPEIGGEHALYFDHDFDPETMRRQFKEGLRLYEEGKIDFARMKEHALGFSWERTAKRYIEIYNDLLREIRWA